MFCRSDIINYGNLHDIDFICTKTLCQGGDCCDFLFVKHRRGEVWHQTSGRKGTNNLRDDQLVPAGIDMKTCCRKRVSLLR